MNPNPDPANRQENPQLKSNFNTRIHNPGDKHGRTEESITKWIMLPSSEAIFTSILGKDIVSLKQIWCLQVTFFLIKSGHACINYQLSSSEEVSGPAERRM